MIKLENLSLEREAKLTENNSVNYDFDYGKIKKNSNGDLELKVISDQEIESLETGRSCGGCTKVTKKRLSETQFLVTINYKTSILGVINNRRAFIYTKIKGNKNIEPKITINLKGKVI